MTGKSKEEIAFELLAKLKGVGIWGENNMSSILDMYSSCLEATSGLRSVDGKAPPAHLLAGQSAAPANAVQAPAPAPAVRQAAPAQPAAPQVPTAQQPQVRQQQQMVQQAFQQQPPVAR